VAEYLSRKGVSFEEIDIRTTPGAIRELQALGVMATPALIAGDRVVVGFDPEMIDQAIAAVPETN
jgi:hypothetical protein